MHCRATAYLLHASRIRDIEPGRAIGEAAREEVVVSRVEFAGDFACSSFHC
jgi:hypothetical protein